jgi:iron complex outermembrane receptor protein
LVNCAVRSTLNGTIDGSPPPARTAFSHTQSLTGFIFEELQIAKKLRFQAAGRIESDSVDGTASTFPPNFLPPPDDPL